MYLASLSCTKEDIRHYLRLSNDAFYGILLKEVEVSSIIEQGYAIRNYRLRVKQMEVAMSGDAKMLIHLGKVYLGQIYNKQPTYKEHSTKSNTIDKTHLKEIAKNILEEM
ncbi:hypothetical protein EF513_07275 [Rickettsiales endosymbiont of Stachyamoeba lipophora]|nr:hypothetical protein EF513_07275 [Rickettsiales endosymbiont of Stachyamoeba lipophora]